MNRIGHYGVEIIAAVLAWTILSLWLPFSLTAIVSLAVVELGVVVITYIAMRHHPRSFCERCYTPLAPIDAARRNSRSLNLVHLSTDRPVVVWLYGMLMIGSTVVIIGRTNIGTIAWWSVMVLSLIYILRANVIHQRLQPWCLKCKRGGTGKVDSTDPFPVDGMYV